MKSSPCSVTSCTNALSTASVAYRRRTMSGSSENATNVLLSAFQQFVEGFPQQGRQDIDVAHRVAVGVDSEIEHPVVGRNADRQHLVVQQRRHGVGLEQLGAPDVHLFLGAR